MRKTLVIVVCATSLVPACSTKEISANPVFISDHIASADHGALMIAFAPRANTNTYEGTIAAEVYMDGVQLASDQYELVPVQPLFVFEGGTSSMGYLPAGRHHFEIKEPRGDVGGATFFAIDVEIAAGIMTELYLFGPADAVRGIFVVYPALVAPGTVHVSLVNLVRTGQSLEVVSCMEGSPCTPLSAPLALGEAFAGDFPVDAAQSSPGPAGPVFSNGAALSYRQVPTGAVPDPPVQPLPQGTWPIWDGLSPPSRTLEAAPYWMSPAGDIQASF